MSNQRGQATSAALRSAFRVLLILLAATALAAIAISPAYAVEDGDAFKAWSARCETPQGAEKVCHLFQVAKDDESGRDLVHVAIGYRGNQPEPLAIISVPLGIFLPPGVLLQIDQGKPIRAPYEVCDPDACRAGFPLSSEMVATLKGGLTLTVILENAVGQKKNLQLSLSGMTAGLNALSQ